jgi:ATP-binding cassette subfamily B protein
MDCGPTCLQMVAKHYGRYFPLQHLREKSFVNREGASLLGISTAAEAIGFKTVGVRIEFNKLAEDATVPCIVHWYQRHYVVVHKIKKGNVYVADPASGLLVYPIEDFKKGWISSKTDGRDEGIALLLEPLPAFYDYQDSEGEGKRPGLGNLLQYLTGNRKFLFQLLIGLLTGSLIQLILPFLTQSIVDVGINTQNVQFIYLVLTAQIILFIGRLSVDFIRRWILLYLSARINISLISEFLTKLFRLPMSFFDGKMIGDILRRIDDHSRIERFISTSSLNIVFSFFNMLVFGVVLLVYNSLIFLTFFGISALYVVYILTFQKRRAELDYRRFQQSADNQSSLIQTIQGMSEIKLNNCETRKRWEWERIQAKLFRLSVDSNKLQQYQDAGSLFLNESKNMIITIMAAVSVIDGSMTLGMMLAVQYIIGQLNTPINDLVTFTRDLQDARISLQRIGEVHSLKNEDELLLLDGPANEKGSISLENISFQYEGPHSPKVLDGIDLTIPEGKVTAIVGSSGSGKTTLMKLLLKFYPPTGGRISLNGENLEHIHSRSWRRNCGAVMQDGFIFADTIARNIALVDEDPIQQKLLHAVQVANIKEFIEALPLRYNTKVGMNGIGLSQGQKQRLLIARAIYKNPSIIFLDEATSALDANNESVIMNNLNKFLEGKTVVVIAHRLSTVRNADQVVVLDNGKVVEIGTHTELTNIRGKYFNLVKNQLELGN